MMAKKKKHVAPFARRATTFDRAAGKIIRERRHEAGMSQERLGELCGITFQQVQKYENGSNRVSLSRFVRIAKALELGPSLLLGSVIHAATVSNGG